MRKFTERNDQIVRLKNPAFFDKDLELFKKKFQIHPLFNQLANVNQFNKAKLDALMITALLDITSPDEILENRTKEIQPDPEPRTEADIQKLLVEHFDFDEKDLTALSEIVPLWIDKTEEEIIYAVEKLMGQVPEQSTSTGTTTATNPIADATATGQAKDVTQPEVPANEAPKETTEIGTPEAPPKVKVPADKKKGAKKKSSPK
ncbi:MAG: hypothetical protein LBR26_13385 [Prevotella sp.]|jgi:hypothetical protein|nr:hypothetical protein [Prevotella sp.]